MYSDWNFEFYVQTTPTMWAAVEPEVDNIQFILLT